MSDMPIRILQFPGTMLYGGVGSVVMNIYRNIDRSKVQFDFCIPREGDGPLDDEIQKLGGRIFHVPQMRKVGFKKYIDAVVSVIRENGPFVAVHIHSVHMGAVILKAAKKAGVQCRIYHVHNTKDAALEKIPIHMFFEKALNRVIKRNATVCLACGKEAGNYIYGTHSFIVIHNAVDTVRFYPYDESRRKQIRAEIGIDEQSIVVGNIARFVPEKNQEYFVKLASHSKKKDIRFAFLLVGDGESRQSILEHAKSEGCDGMFFSVGNKNDVENYYNAMDVFCLPSLFEGLPVTLLEAQACGLPCITSNCVTEEANMGIAPYSRISIEDDRVDTWIESISSFSNKREGSKQVILSRLGEKRYEIAGIAATVQSIYLTR